MNDKLEAAAAAEVAEWQAKVRTITQNIEEAEAIVTASARRRSEHVLAASLGDDAARKHLEQVLEDDRQAERQLHDLRLALPMATARLKEAEAAHQAEIKAVRRQEFERLARKRVEAAEKIDAAIRDFSLAWSEYEQLGVQLYSAADDHGNQISLLERFDGLLRLASALPHQPFFDLRHKHSFAQIGGGAPLAVSEAAFWRVTPIEETKAA